MTAVGPHEEEEQKKEQSPVAQKTWTLWILTSSSR